MRLGAERACLIVREKYHEFISTADEQRVWLVWMETFQHVTNTPSISYTYISKALSCFIVVCFPFSQLHDSSECLHNNRLREKKVPWSILLRFSSKKSIIISCYSYYLYIYSIFIPSKLPFSSSFFPHFFIFLCPSPWFPERWVSKKQVGIIKHVLLDVISLSPDDN